MGLNRMGLGLPQLGLGELILGNFGAEGLKGFAEFFLGGGAFAGVLCDCDVVGYVHVYYGRLVPVLASELLRCGKEAGSLGGF